MSDLILRAMVRGMWKDARNCAGLGKPTLLQLSNQRDFSCSYMRGFGWVRANRIQAATAAALDYAAEFRRMGDFDGARKWIEFNRKLRRAFK